MADDLVVLRNGEVQLSGDLQSCLTRLNLPEYLREETSSVLQAEVAEVDGQWQLAKIKFSGGDLWLRNKEMHIGQQVRVRVLARDISLSLSKQENTSIANILPGTVIDLNDDQNKGLALVKLKLGEDMILARVSSRSRRTFEFKARKGTLGPN